MSIYGRNLLRIEQRAKTVVQIKMKKTSLEITMFTSVETARKIFADMITLSGIQVMIPKTLSGTTVKTAVAIPKAHDRLSMKRFFKTQVPL
jgi:hypothetical protein